MANLLITDAFGNAGENLCMFTENPAINAEVVEKWLDRVKVSYTEVVEVKDEDLQYYLYEPYNLTESSEEKILNA